MIGQIWEVDTIDAFGEHAAFFLDDFSSRQAKAFYPRLTIDRYTPLYILLPTEDTTIRPVESAVPGEFVSPVCTQYIMLAKQVP